MRVKTKKAHKKAAIYIRCLRLSKNPGVDKGPQPLMALFGFGDMCGKSAKGACVARLSLHEVLAAP